MSMDDVFERLNKGKRCGRCGETMGAADDAHKAILALLERNTARAARACNYVANTEESPTRILFGNGRVVELKDGRLEVGWARDEAERVFVHAQNSNMEKP